MDDAGFLRAIRADIHADGPRLVYADWLDEQGDPRAEYLRLQVALKERWSYTNPCPEIYARLAELRQAIDEGWLTAVRRCTTPPPLVDVEAAIPELKGKAKTAVRLHPRRGEAGIDESKIGGTFLWSADEEWPSCPEHETPLIAVLQLRKEDVPETGFKKGTDLLQVLWCPHDHEPYFCPEIEVYWWKRADIGTPAAAQPAHTSSDSGNVPTPCVLYPERVAEYPGLYEAGMRYEDDPTLNAALDVVKVERSLWSFPDDGADLCYAALSLSDGTKAGGTPRWVQGDEYPTCSYGRLMPLLVQFDSNEFDGATWFRWLPVEDREYLDAEYRTREEVQNAAEWMFGDAGCIYLFACDTCPTRPVRWVMQCS